MLTKTPCGKYDMDFEKNYCACMGWKMQKIAPQFRTCKHLLAEQVRRLGGRVPAAGKPAKITEGRLKNDETLFTKPRERRRLLIGQEESGT